MEMHLAQCVEQSEFERYTNSLTGYIILHVNVSRGTTMLNHVMKVTEILRRIITRLIAGRCG